MVMAEIEMLLKSRLGLDSASIGSTLIERAVRDRLAACRLPDLQVYLEHLRNSEAELQELIESVVVPETWFLRDRSAFAALTQWTVGDWWPAHPEGKLRLLSLPCATGEEAYSLAIALLEAGLPASRFKIEAIDVSERALAVARKGVYGKNSFRGAEIDFRDRHFEKGPAGYRLNENIRQQVRFQAGNLLDPLFHPATGPYDIIFCRNLLIYFDRPTQDRAVGILLRLLAPGGLLFVGPAETSLLSSHQMVSIKLPMAFAFRRKDPAEKTAPLPAQRETAPLRPARFISPATARPAPLKPIETAITPTASPPTAELDTAARLADEGHLVEAARTCETFIREHGASARAYYLLGLVRDAAGEPIEAASFYRKAIYLEPEHPEALVQLALLLGRQGETVAARMLHDRAARLHLKSGK
jgi:chemotaxis protein methyltransferase WspC